MSHIQSYQSVGSILKDYPESVVLVGRLYGQNHHRICCHLYILTINPLAYFIYPHDKYPSGLAVKRGDVQGIADRYYKLYNLYINNTLKIYER